MGFPQIYVQALAGVMLSLSWTDIELRKSKLKPWAVLKSDAHEELAPKSSDFILNPNEETLQSNSA